MDGRFSKRPFRFFMWRRQGRYWEAQGEGGWYWPLGERGRFRSEGGPLFAVGRAVLPYALRGDGVIFCLRVGDGTGKERLRHGVWLFYFHRIVKIQTVSPFRWRAPYLRQVLGYSFGTSRKHQPFPMTQPKEKGTYGVYSVSP